MSHTVKIGITSYARQLDEAVQDGSLQEICDENKIQG